MADMTDLFTAAMNGGVATPTTVAEERSAGTPTLVGTALTNWPTTGASGADSAVFFITAPTTADKGGDTVLDNTQLMLWKAIVSGNTLTNLSLEYSATGEDIGNSVGDVIQIAPTSAWAQAIYQGLTTTVFNNDGSLQDSIIGTDQIQDSAITTDTLAESAVELPNISTGSDMAWQSWTPSFVGLTVGNGTVTANYIQMGKVVNFNVLFVLGSTSSIGTTGVTFSLPVAANATTYPLTASRSGHTIGTGYCVVSTSNDRFPTYANINSAADQSSAEILTPVSSSDGLLTGLISTSPATWSAGNILQLSGTYEAA